MPPEHSSEEVEQESADNAVTVLPASPRIELPPLPVFSDDNGEWVTIAGYGSLLCEASAKRTLPSLRNFRIGKLLGFRRVFNLVSVSLLRRGFSTWTEEKRVAAVAVRPDQGSSVVVSLFDAPKSEISHYCEREHRYQFLVAKAVEDNSATLRDVLVCSEFNDVEYRRERFGLTWSREDGFQESVGEQEKEKFATRKDRWIELVGQYYNEALWREDILPNDHYTEFCLEAAAGLGVEPTVSFLWDSYLADGKTPLAAHVMSHKPLRRKLEELLTAFSEEERAVILKEV